MDSHAQRLERRRLIINMRLRGMSYRAIGAALTPPISGQRVLQIEQKAPQVPGRPRKM